MFELYVFGVFLIMEKYTMFVKICHVLVALDDCDKAKCICEDGTHKIEFTFCDGHTATVTCDDHDHACKVLDCCEKCDVDCCRDEE